MKTILLLLMAAMVLGPLASLADDLPQPPASWVAFQEDEKAKRAAFFQQMKADRDAFLSSHPEAKAYMDQMHAASKARFEAWKAAHHRS